MPDWNKRQKKEKNSHARATDKADLEFSNEALDWDRSNSETTYLQEAHQEPTPLEQEPIPPEEEPTSKADDRPLKATDVLSYLLIFIFLMLLVPATIISTFEILNRLSFLSLIEQEIAQQKIVLKAFDKNYATSDNNKKEKSAARNALRTLEKFREAARSIITNGAIPLENDMFSFRDLMVLKAKKPQGRSVLSAILQGKTVINKSNLQERFPFTAFLRDISQSIDHFNDLFFGFICNYSSNALMAVSLIFSCIIGALSCYYRKGTGTPPLLRFIISGLVMGFLVYLVIKGGNNLFMPSTEVGITLQLDLYGACLIAFFAGMFADRLFWVFHALAGLLDRRSSA